MRPEGSPHELEARRLQAIRLLEMGYGATEVAKILQATRSTVQHWKSRFRVHGQKALLAKPAPGALPKLAPKHKRQLVRVLLKGAQAHGFATDLWTSRRVARIVHSQFGVTYHLCYIPRLLRSLDWSPQRPERRAYERDEEAIRHWIGYDWPRIKKSPQA